MTVATDDDPYRWLEEVEGASALGWAGERNAETVAKLATGARFEAMRTEIREVLDATERIPYPGFRGEHLYNFWKDEAHPRGLWRRTTVDSFRAAEPSWEVLLDVDALAEAEQENWVWQSPMGLGPEHRRYLISLSRGGADASVVREFDLVDGWIGDGFQLPEAKSWVSWIDIDHVFVATDFGPGSLTDSGYPRVVKRWTRGTPLDAAEVVFEGQPSDVNVGAGHDQTPGFPRDFVYVSPSFFETETYLLRDAGLTRIEAPSDADVDVHREWLLIRLRTEWTVGGTTHPAGSLLAAGFDEFLAGGRDFTVLFAPAPDVALNDHQWTRHHLLLGLLRDVRSELVVLDPADGWRRSTLDGLPAGSHTTVAGTNPDLTDELLLSSTGFTEPSTLRYGQVGQAFEVVKREPSFFDVEGLQVAQHFATSPDGTRVPYFVVGRPGSTGPTLLSAYGGFEISRTPAYDAALGRAWLSRGGTYVVANIRGGGEYGPDWHRAAMRENRPLAFADCAAVAADLVERGITEPARLGFQGGSNGGLLAGVMLTRYPEHFGAVVGTVPLLDMRRYHTLLAGASWMAEYGDPDDPDDWAFISRYSPYHNVHSGQNVPPVLWVTSTRDDRVHPGHARKMTARLRDLGFDVSYYENIEGGHGAAADNAQLAFHKALAYEFLWQTLTGDGPDRRADRADHGRLLIRQGRDDEGMAELEALRPALLTDADMPGRLTGVLVEVDRAALAHEWLTDAVERTKEAIDAAPQGEGVSRLAVFYELIRNRHDVRHRLDLPHDGYDELAETMTTEMVTSTEDAADHEDDEEPVLLFWSQPELDRLLRQWPDLAGQTGADWDEHRGLVERSLHDLSASSAVPPALIAGSVDGLVEFAAELDLDPARPGEGHDPSDPLVLMGYLESLEGPLIEWPPGRNDDCWCGSRLKYKKCCLPGSRA